MAAPPTGSDAAPAPWTAPDARPEEPGPAIVVPVAAPAAAGAGEHRHVTAGPPEVPVPLRPMSLSDRIDGALRIWKLAPGTAVAVAAAAIVPVEIVSAIALRGAPGTVEGDEQLEAVWGRAVSVLLTDDVGSRVAAALAVALLELFALAFVAAAIADLVAGWYVGTRRGAGELLARAARRLPALGLAWLLVHAAEAAAGVLAVLPVVVPMTLYAVVAPVIGVEGVGPWRALGRSFGLTRRAFATVAGTCLVVALVDVVLRSALSTIGLLYLETGAPAGWAVAAAVGLGGRLVTVPFVAGCAALQYLDLRVRLEGLDIEVAAAEGFPLAS